MATDKCRVGMIGAGAFGTAMAYHIAGPAGHTVTLWAREAGLVDRINRTRENAGYLPGVTAPERITATTNIEEALAADYVFLAVPTPYIEATLGPIADKLRPDSILVSCSKGILNGTLETPEQLLRRILPGHGRLAFLSGPSFAKEVAQGLPTMVTIAARDEEVARSVQTILSTPLFRCYRTTDVMGVEMGGALKNVLAIGCGISDGVGYGHNSRAALITRGLAEVTSIVTAMGGSPLTMLGLGGIGDLVLTCTGDLSRNRTVGLRLGRGETLDAICASMGGSHAEGVLTSKSAYQLFKSLGLECASLEGIYRVLHEGADPRQVTKENMSRELKHEVPATVQASFAAAAAASGGAAAPHGSAAH